MNMMFAALHISEMNTSSDSTVHLTSKFRFKHTVQMGVKYTISGAVNVGDLTLVRRDKINKS